METGGRKRAEGLGDVLAAKLSWRLRTWGRRRGSAQMEDLVLAAEDLVLAVEHLVHVSALENS
eukprot:12371958-Heterocapsa_arctica.AAC.1